MRLHVRVREPDELLVHRLHFPRDQQRAKPGTQSGKHKGEEESQEMGAERIHGPAARRKHWRRRGGGVECDVTSSGLAALWLSHAQAR